MISLEMSVHVFLMISKHKVENKELTLGNQLVQIIVGTAVMITNNLVWCRDLNSNIRNTICYLVASLAMVCLIPTFQTDSVSPLKFLLINLTVFVL